MERESEFFWVKREKEREINLIFPLASFYVNSRAVFPPSLVFRQDSEESRHARESGNEKRMRRI